MDRRAFIKTVGAVTASSVIPSFAMAEGEVPSLLPAKGRNIFYINTSQNHPQVDEIVEWYDRMVEKKHVQVLLRGSHLEYVVDIEKPVLFVNPGPLCMTSDFSKIEDHLGLRFSLYDSFTSSTPVIETGNVWYGKAKVFGILKPYVDYDRVRDFCRPDIELIRSYLEAYKLLTS